MQKNIGEAPDAMETALTVFLSGRNGVLRTTPRCKGLLVTFAASM